MSYYFARKVDCSFEEAVDRVTDLLASEGFGVLTEIDIAETMKKKLGVDFRPYRILGACNPDFAHKALLAEDKIGTLLPCNVIIHELSDGAIEVAAVDPAASMSAVDNEALGDIAETVGASMQRIVASM